MAVYRLFVAEDADDFSYDDHLLVDAGVLPDPEDEVDLRTEWTYLSEAHQRVVAVLNRGNGSRSKTVAKVEALLAAILRGRRFGR
jgi:hypothetical protein